MSDTGSVNTPLPPNGEDLSLRELLRNYISLIGLALAAVSLANIIFLFLLDLLSKRPSPYIGLLAYMVMPGFFVFGLLLVPFGMWRQRSLHRRKLPTLPKFPLLDLNNPAQRSSIAFFLAFVVLFVIMSAIGSYQGYEYTDSTQFCGQLCHTVMHPEYTAHQNSPHARVRCVDCHVGNGASWYVRSKMSGLRQVYYTVLGTYPRPIETPVANLRPAPETCEQCHWPKKFWGAQLKVINEFGDDEKNTPRQISLLIKTGGGDANNGEAMGIHWHMNIANVVMYKSDPTRMNIPWVQITDREGRTTVFTEKGVDAATINKMAERRMDCVDCHNRPTHDFPPPDRSVDNALATNRIDRNLPYAKMEGVQLLTATYKTTPEALQAIATQIPAFYKDKYPDIAKSKAGEIEEMVSQLQKIFQRTIFPEMKVTWQTHPNNIGHYYFQGCFRCHDGNHVSPDGKVITKDCNACHTILSQTEGAASIAATPQGMQFKHPVDIGDLKDVNCSDCHTGGVGP